MSELVTCKKPLRNYPMDVVWAFSGETADQSSGDVRSIKYLEGADLTGVKRNNHLREVVVSMFVFFVFEHFFCSVL
jgi:hypothetical protein